MGTADGMRPAGRSLENPVVEVSFLDMTGENAVTCSLLAELLVILLAGISFAYLAIAFQLQRLYSFEFECQERKV
jgi:hypothetical protein